MGEREGHEKPMTDLTPNEKRRQTMLKKYGSEEAIRKMRQAAQKKSRENYSGDGGLRSLSPERRSEIASLGGRARWTKKTDEKD